MKASILLLTIIFSLNLLAQKSTDLIVGQTNFSWENKNWIAQDSLINTYDNHNNILKEETQIYNLTNKKFEIKRHRISSYNELDNIISKKDQDWNKETQKWENSETWVYEYDSSNLLVTILSESYWSWDNTKKGSQTINSPIGSKYIQTFTYNSKNLQKTHNYHQKLIEGQNKQITSFYLNTYDRKNRLIYSEVHEWDNSLDTTKVVQKFFIDFDLNGNKISERTEVMSGDQGGFRVLEQHTFTYDSKNNLIKDVSQRYSYNKNVFGNDREIIFTYDSKNNQLTELRRDWDEASKEYVDTKRYNFTYDENSNQLSETWQNYDQFKKVYLNHRKKLYEYDNRNNEIEKIIQNWDEKQNQWINESKTNSYYHLAANYKKNEVKLVISDWTNEQLEKANTAKNIDFLTQIEKETIMYINLARLYPKQYFSLELEDYNGTQENKTYLQNSTFKASLIKTLDTIKPVEALIIDPYQYDLAKCFAVESGEKGIRGHDRKKCKDGYDAECVSYGMTNGKDIAMQLLIDHNVSSLAHRGICLNQKYATVGIFKYDHSKNGTRAVLDFGTRFHK